MRHQKDAARNVASPVARTTKPRRATSALPFSMKKAVSDKTLAVGVKTHLPVRRLRKSARMVASEKEVILVVKPTLKTFAAVLMGAYGALVAPSA
mmetsp:Transcript_1979/g.3618  ORF Transcript_1979/g.3618 Transcript_1979/m.3618 type:complete len:95 (-) Transcript_1979:1450-1734(-)